MSKKIEFNVSFEERERLDLEAAAHGVSRAQLIRERALSPGVALKHLDLKAQERAITILNQNFVGVPRDYLERLVNTVVAALAAES